MKKQMGKFKETLSDAWMPSPEEMAEEGNMEHRKAMKQLENWLDGKPIVIPQAKRYWDIDKRNFKGEELLEVQQDSAREVKNYTFKGWGPDTGRSQDYGEY